MPGKGSFLLLGRLFPTDRTDCLQGQIWFGKESIVVSARQSDDLSIYIFSVIGPFFEEAKNIQEIKTKQYCK